MRLRDRVFTGWNFKRLIFVFLGGSLITQSIQQSQWIGIIIGGYFAFMGVFATGCAARNCYDNNCYSNTKKEKTL